MSRLKDKRTILGLSQSKLSMKSGVPIQAIQHYEQGFRSINKAQAGTLKKLVDVLGCSIEDILEDEEENEDS